MRPSSQILWCHCMCNSSLSFETFQVAKSKDENRKRLRQSMKDSDKKTNFRGNLLQLRRFLKFRFATRNKLKGTTGRRIGFVCFQILNCLHCHKESKTQQQGRTSSLNECEPHYSRAESCCSHKSFHIHCASAFMFVMRGIQTYHQQGGGKMERDDAFS